MTVANLKYENHLDEHEAKWFAVYTRYKREKIVKEQLANKGIHCFLPLQKVKRQYTRKVKNLEIPLLSCYIFTKIVKNEYVQVLETNDVVQFVKFSNNLISIPECEIDLMKRIIGENIEVEATPISGLQKGDLVEIHAGPLAGLRGTFVQAHNSKNFVISLHQMGYALHMQIDRTNLRKV
ncbi:MAG: UpxY family transcription antiterminator [Bacteroidota bacterium]